MNGRKKTLVIYGVCYLLVAASLFIGLKKIKNNFSQEKLDVMLSRTSLYRDKTDDLCKYRIIGDPEKVGNKYVKINFWCGNARESRNALSLEAVNGNTVKAVLTEFARIIGFDYGKIKEKN